MNTEEIDPKVKYNLTFENQTFRDIDSQKYLFCTFIECNFLSCKTIGIKELFKNNSLKNCWYDPTLLFSDIIDSLHPNVNFVDAFNKALIHNSNKKNKLNHKQLIMIDLLD